MAFTFDLFTLNLRSINTAVNSTLFQISARSVDHRLRYWGSSAKIFVCFYGVPTNQHGCFEMRMAGDRSAIQISYCVFKRGCLKSHWAISPKITLLDPPVEIRGELGRWLWEPFHIHHDRTSGIHFMVCRCVVQQNVGSSIQKCTSKPQGLQQHTYIGWPNKKLNRTKLWVCGKLLRQTELREYLG